MIHGRHIGMKESNNKKADFSKRREVVSIGRRDFRPVGNPSVGSVLDCFLGEEDSRKLDDHEESVDYVYEDDDDDNDGEQEDSEAEGEVHDVLSVEKLKALLYEPNMGLHELINNKALLEGFQKKMEEMKRLNPKIN